MYNVDEKKYLINNKGTSISDTIVVMLDNGIILSIPVVVCSIAIFLFF